jgi:hypothetical protein
LLLLLLLRFAASTSTLCESLSLSEVMGMASALPAYAESEELRASPDAVFWANGRFRSPPWERVTRKNWPWTCSLRRRRLNRRFSIGLDKAQTSKKQRASPPALFSYVSPMPPSQSRTENYGSNRLSELPQGAAPLTRNPPHRVDLVGTCRISFLGLIALLCIFPTVTGLAWWLSELSYLRCTVEDIAQTLRSLGAVAKQALCRPLPLGQQVGEPVCVHPSKLERMEQDWLLLPLEELWISANRIAAT